ncbi:MAG: hypothetical protein VCA57_14050 [Pseudomonas sp.]
MTTLKATPTDPQRRAPLCGSGVAVAKSLTCISRVSPVFGHNQRSILELP